jgi:hypothetical protein
MDNLYTTRYLVWTFRVVENQKWRQLSVAGFPLAWAKRGSDHGGSFEGVLSRHCLLVNPTEERIP